MIRAILTTSNDRPIKILAHNAVHAALLASQVRPV
jgi:hypothetical protein